MANKVLKTRIVNKHDVEENWNKAINFIPKTGEIIVYDADSTHTCPRFKVGDGKTFVSSLPFVNANVEKALEGKVDKVSGKGLSSNDYTSSDKDSVKNSANALNSSINIRKAASLANGTDLNGQQTEGFYYAGGSHNCKNCPNDRNQGFGLVVVRTASGYKQQVYFQADVVDETNSVIYTRSYGSNEWTKWHRVVFDRDIEKCKFVYEDLGAI